MILRLRGEDGSERLHCGDDPAGPPLPRLLCRHDDAPHGH